MDAKQGRIILAAALAAALVSTPVTAAPLQCTFDHKLECGRGGCEPVDVVGIWSRIDQQRGSYARCSWRGCDVFVAGFTQSGAFTVIDVPGINVMAKLSAADWNLVEVGDPRHGRRDQLRVVPPGVVCAELG
jgi:hypothetical protein